MQIIPVRTHKITSKDKDILSIIDKYIPSLSENSVVVVTSKIVAITEGSIIPVGSVDKDDLVMQEADRYLPKEKNTYKLLVTIKNSILAVNAGVDESNSEGEYVLWPKDSQESANLIRHHLAKKHNLKNIGVIITDSKTTPLRYGVTGIGMAGSGFMALNDLIGTPDIFGRKFKMTQVNVMDGLAAGAVVVMGESSEQTPFAIVTDVPFVQFQNRAPTKEELDLMQIDPKTDVYGEILKYADWKKGKNS